MAGRNDGTAAYFTHLIHQDPCVEGVTHAYQLGSAEFTCATSPHVYCPSRSPFMILFFFSGLWSIMWEM